MKKYVVNSQKALLVFCFWSGDKATLETSYLHWCQDTLVYCVKNTCRCFLGQILLLHNTSNIYLFPKWSEVLMTDFVKKRNPKTLCHFIISLCRRCCGQGVLFSECHCFHAEQKCTLVVLLLDYGHGSLRSLRQKLGGIPLLPLFTFPPTVQVFPSVFSWYSSYARKHLVKAPSSEVVLETFRKRERVPHLLD